MDGSASPHAPLRVLLLEDLPTDAELLVRELKRAGLGVAHRLVETEEAFRTALQDFQPDLILADFFIPHFDGMCALKLSRELAPDVPFIFVSGTISEEYPIRALRNGAADYVLKNNLVRLPVAVERALRAREESAARRIADARHRATFDNAPIGIMHTDIDADRILLVNPKLIELLGYTEDELLAMTTNDILHPDQRGTDRGKYRERMLKGELNSFSSERRLVRKDGSDIWVNRTVSLVRDAAGKPLYFIRMVEDVTERKSQELKISRLSRIHAVLSGINSTIVRVRDRQELFNEACRIAVEHGNFGMAWIGMLDRKTLDVVPAACAGVEAESFIATSPNTASPFTPLGEGMVGRAIRERRAVYSNDITAERSPGGARRQEAIRRGYRSLIVLPLLVEDEAVGNLSLFAQEPDFFDDEEIKLLNDLAGDISFALEHIAKEEKLEYLYYYDPLTGLPNRQLFVDRLSQQMRARGAEQRMVALILFDLERFRNINDTLGRRGGDELLRLIARRAEDACNGKDYLAHIGADIFGAVIRGMRDAAEIAHAVESRVLACFREPFVVDGKELRAAPRAGVALFPTDGGDADTLFKNAEAALKKAKASGERCLFYAPQMNAAVAETLLLENKLRRALDREQFVLHYQPKVDLAKGTIGGLEALIRWNDPETGLIPPMNFIPLLEETGMILEAGRWAMGRAVADCREWHTDGQSPPRIAVNVSPIQLRQKDFVDVVRNAISEGIAGSHGLDLEITESLLMEDIEGNIEKLRAVRDLGVNIAIDDFGTGYSSLCYLAKLPVNALKIDRSFIITMCGSADSMTIVSTIISLAHALNLKVIAEGVDVEEQRTVLRLLKCDEMQGYLFSRPVPASEVEALLAAGRSDK